MGLRGRQPSSGGHDDLAQRFDIGEAIKMPGQLVIAAVTLLIVLANSVAAADRQERIVLKTKADDCLSRALAVVQRDQELKDAKLSAELTMLRICRAAIDSYLQAVLGVADQSAAIDYVDQFTEKSWPHQR
jgi:hypothetical protein